MFVQANWISKQLMKSKLIWNQFSPKKNIWFWVLRKSIIFLITSCIEYSVTCVRMLGFIYWEFPHFKGDHFLFHFMVPHTICKSHIFFKTINLRSLHIDCGFSVSANMYLGYTFLSWQEENNQKIFFKLA